MPIEINVKKKCGLGRIYANPGVNAGTEGVYKSKRPSLKGPVTILCKDFLSFKTGFEIDNQARF